MIAEVVLQDSDGELQGWGPEEVSDLAHAADLARDRYPDLEILEVMEVDL